jgi:hypothetical protein
VQIKPPLKSSTYTTAPTMSYVHHSIFCS